VKNNHLTYFKIENFKKFDSLEVNDIGQFNLIVGDNNVGKTCLLEALLFDEDAGQLLDNFYIALTKRGLKFQIEKITSEVKGISTTKTIYPKENYFKNYIFKKYSKDGVKLNIIYNNKKEEPLEIVLRVPEKIDSEWIQEGSDLDKHFKKEGIRIEDFEKEYFNMYLNGIPTRQLSVYSYNKNILNFPLISFNDTPLEEESRNIYENFKTKREKQILIDVLKVVNPKIKDIEFRVRFDGLNSFFLISFDDEEDFIKLNALGDGFKRIFYIILKTISLKGKRILIDEIEIGIHYSKMKDFWINIMKVCKELDVQLFATTHSQECTETYIEASNLLNYNNDIRLIKLEESTNKDKIYASTFTYNQISAGLNSNVELRG
jgi:AAA15 family ATPase/GTPase